MCVLLCFIEHIVGDNEPGVLNRGQRIHAHHLNYVAGSTGPHLPHLQTDPATNASDAAMGMLLCSLVAWLWEFCRTLEIITRTLREVVNRVRLCGHHTPFELFA